jgi:putative CocE/NonD family hydrolase
MQLRPAVAAGLGLSLVLAGLAASARAAGPTATCNIPIRMSDGAVMRANVTTPGPGRHPTVVTVTGYGKGAGQNCAPSTDPLVAAGYNIVTIDDRGTGSSGGRWDIWQERTQQDYVEEARWIVRQPWATRELGTQGGSYLGITSLLFAERNPDLVKAVFANVPMSDAYRDVTYFGGMLDSTFMPFWFGATQGMGGTGTFDLLMQDAAQPTGPDFLQNLYDHSSAAPAAVGAQLVAAAVKGEQTGDYAPYDSKMLRLRSPVTQASKVKAAVFYTGGWFDIFQRGEPFLFNSFTNAEKVVWVQDSTYHAGGTSHFGDLKWGAQSDVKVKWFDRYLKGKRNGIDQLPAINHWNVNGNRWDHPGGWPVPSTKWTSYWLSPADSGSSPHSLDDGSLTTIRPRTPARQLLPFNPVGGLCNRSTIQWSAGLANGTPCESDQRGAELGTFSYTTPALPKALHLEGPITLDLAAELDRPDASFYAALTDVAPDGSSTQITSGGLLASHNVLDQKRTWRNSAGDVILPYHPFTAAAQRDVPLNDPQLYRIEIYPTSWTLLPGHRLRLVLGTANTPNFTVPQDRLQKMLGGTIRVISGPNASMSSRLLLPFVPR